MLPDFLTASADRDGADQLPPFPFEAAGVLARYVSQYVDNGRPENEAQTLRDLGAGLMSSPRGDDTFGAFDASERADVLDRLGFAKQFIFSLLSTSMLFEVNVTPDIAYGGCRTHSRSMAECCADERLVGVDLLLIEDVERPITDLDYMASLGLEALWIPHRSASGHSSGHAVLRLPLGPLC